MLRRSPALVLFWFLLIAGGTMLGVGDPSKEILPRSFAVNWEAIGAIALIGISFISGTWFVVSMAMVSIVRESEARLRGEMADTDSGYVPVPLCKAMHSDTERRVERLEKNG